ncbi:Uncharacterised protein [Cedecea neteri]|uniref:Uncharacterized protein n=1 Tax=Cedecea neteri TaxID=158822 RepID=A0A2X2T8A7_9ENTR|nr:Uncharacterised protein [Cedecea neteri]
MTALGEVLPRREDEIRGIEGDRTVQVKPVDAGQHYALAGKLDDVMGDQRFCYRVGGFQVVVTVPFLPRFEQRPGDKRIAVGGVVFVGE